MSVIQLLSQAVQQIVAVYALAFQIVSSLVTSGWYLVVRDAATVTQDIHDILDDPTCGQAAQCTKLDTLLSDVSTLLSDVAALGNPQQSLIPVTLPTTPPAGYGGPSTGDVATAVWSFPNSPTSDTMAGLMTRLAYLIDAFANNAGLPHGEGLPFIVTASLGSADAEPWGSFPRYNPDTILPTDADVGAWLNRVANSGETWQQDDWTSLWVSFDLGVSDNPPTWYCTLTDQEFRQIQAGVITGSTGAPIWPGLANVTLGTAHAMVPPGEAITIDCDGVIIAVTGVPSWAGSFSFGTAISYRNVGAVTFTTDNGEQEFAQTFSWTSGIYLPKAQAHASGYAYRAAVGVSGTITPFTIN